MTDALMTPEEAARVLGLSAFTVRRLLREGELPGRKVGKRQWRIRRVELEAYLVTPGAFQQPHSLPLRLTTLAAEQGVRPITDFDSLLGSAGLDEGEDADAEQFLGSILSLRENSPAGSDI